MVSFPGGRPPNDPLFDSAWFKWGHGVAHAQALEADIDAFRFDGHRDPLLANRAEYNPKRHGFAVYATDVAPIPTRWGLMLGDIANNYRCALDHLAWALVCRGKTPPATLTEYQQGGVYFPAAEGRKQFNDSLPKKLPGVRRADIALVRRTQPYHYRPRTRRRHYLTVLTALNNSDKHRALQPIWVQPTRIDIEITRMQDCWVPQLGFRRHADPLEVGTEITFIRARKRGREPHLEVDLRVAAEPSIEQRIGGKEWIRKCAAFTASLLREFSAPPDELVARPELFIWLQGPLPAAGHSAGT
jgi:hypothetical protein